MVSETKYAGYRPGALADVVGLHMAYYSRHWGFGLAFETKVAGELSEFLSRYNPDQDLFLLALDADSKCVGSIVLDCTDPTENGVHLRWFVVDQMQAGRGIGKELLNRAIAHCQQLMFCRIYLTTFDGLHAARSLYESVGFKLVKERDEDQWAGDVKEQLFERHVTVDTDHASLLV